MNEDKINTIADDLTKRWTAMVRSRVEKSLGPDSRLFLNRLEANGRTALYYKKEQLLEKALDVIPIQRLYSEAEEKLERMGGEGSIEDIVIQRLLHWFKNDFFQWVNNAPCSRCSSTQTVSNGIAPPHQEDLQYGAHTVEIYRCLSCDSLTRFPRYNDPGKLLETKRGRCGEWANCFTLCCNAVGSEARIVFDVTDHVWTEVYSDYEQRWIHCDACEEAWDTPLIYSMGWNKQLSYCTAFSVNEAIDVTKRYVREWPTVLKRRNKVNEAALFIFLEDLTHKYQKGLDKQTQQHFYERRMREFLELERESKKTIVNEDELIGRTSGSLDWRLQRGEVGSAPSHVKEMSLLDINLYKTNTVYIDNQCKLRLLGSAYQETSQQCLLSKTPMIRLTKAVSDQCGGMYFPDSIRQDSTLKGIEVEFAFCVSDGKGCPANGGADGFAFVIQSQNESALGLGGCELGYGGIRNSLAIEFDTYQSSDRCADLSSNHISIQARRPPQPNSAHHDYSLGYTSHVPLFQTGQWFKSKIRLLSNGVIEIGIGEADSEEYIQVLKVSDQNFLDYVGTINKQIWVGFTASTGGLSECHDIQWISITEYRSPEQENKE